MSDRKTVKMLKAASNSLSKLKEEIMEKNRVKFKAENTVRRVRLDYPPKLPVVKWFEFDEHIPEHSGSKNSEWRTKGNPDAYDMDKVLEALGEVNDLSGKKRTKAQKKKRISNPNDLKPARQESNVQPGNHSSDVGFESVQKYIDSLEQENQTLKASQQFYDFMESDYLKIQKDNENMKKDLEKLNDKLQCKVCMEEDACIVFIPCGHLISCMDCSPGLHNCAICRIPVKSTIRTYFS